MPHNNAARTSRSRLVLLALVVFALALTLSACSSSSKGGSASGDAADITVKDFEFSTTPVKAGATVTVHNDGPATHTVTADEDGSFDVTVDSGDDATFTAPDKAGTYKFHCNIHSQMQGTLTVE